MISFCANRFSAIFLSPTQIAPSRLVLISLHQSLLVSSPLFEYSNTSSVLHHPIPLLLYPQFSPFNTSIHSTHSLFLYHLSPLHSMHPSPLNFPLFTSLLLHLLLPFPSSPLAVPTPPPLPWQRAWVWACFLSRQPTSACPHCEQGKYAPLCLRGARPSMWKWSECRLVNQSIEQTCLKPCPWNPSLLLFHAWQMS